MLRPSFFVVVVFLAHNNHLRIQRYRLLHFPRCRFAFHGCCTVMTQELMTRCGVFSEHVQPILVHAMLACAITPFASVAKSNDVYIEWLGPGDSPSYFHCEVLTRLSGF